MRRLCGAGALPRDIQQSILGLTLRVMMTIEDGAVSVGGVAVSVRMGVGGAVPKVDGVAGPAEMVLVSGERGEGGRACRKAEDMPSGTEVVGVGMGGGSVEAGGGEGLEGERVVELESCVGGHGGTTGRGVEEGRSGVETGRGGEGCGGGRT
jgi:hypothetical protein